MSTEPNGPDTAAPGVDPTQALTTTRPRMPEADPNERLDHYLSTKVAPSLAALLPRNSSYTAEAMLKLTMMAVHENPALAKCSLGSIALALHKVARLRLIIGETIYLVPIKNECHAWVGYQGLMQLAMESGLVRDMVPYVVWDTDIFEFGHGLEEYCRHYPGRKQPAGKEPVITHAWVRIVKRYGVVSFHVMPYDKIDARRRTSKNPALKDLKDSPEWYCKKTVIRDWLNRQPKNARLQEALRGDEEDDRPTVIDGVTGEVLER